MSRYTAERNRKLRLNQPRSAIDGGMQNYSERSSTKWSDAGVIDHLTRLARDADGAELVAALCHGSRASFNVSEAAELLSVSAKHLYAVIASTGEVAPGVDVIHSGDRKMIPAHHLRAFLRIPEPHIEHDRNEPECVVQLDQLSPIALYALAESIAHSLLVRLDAVHAIQLPPIEETENDNE
jgi:hypothetical protein